MQGNSERTNKKPKGGSAQPEKRKENAKEPKTVSRKQCEIGF